MPDPIGQAAREDCEDAPKRAEVAGEPPHVSVSQPEIRRAEPEQRRDDPAVEPHEPEAQPKQSDHSPLVSSIPGSRSGGAAGVRALHDPPNEKRRTYVVVMAARAAFALPLYSSVCLPASARQRVCY